MISHEVVVSMERALRSQVQNNKDVLLVLATNYETRRQSQESVRNSGCYTLAETDILAIAEFHQQVVAGGKESLSLAQLMKRRGFPPYRPTISRPSTFDDVKNGYDTGITAGALEVTKFNFPLDVNTSEFVQQLIEEINRDFRSVLLGCDAFKRVGSPVREGGYLAMHPYPYILGIQTAWNIVDPSNMLVYR